MYAGDIKERVREATDVIDLISQYTDLRSAGSRMKGLSPFTHEKTPSFFVDPDTGMYYCFSSNKGGDIFTFVQEIEGVSFREALKILADRAGIEIGKQNDQPMKDANTKMYHILESTLSVYQKNITDDVREYLARRGITGEMVEQWGIGYAPDDWHTLCTQQTSPLDDYVRTGMCVQKDKSVYDRFRDRIMFPFYDINSRIIGFSGRDYGGKTGAKYINSPESPLFNKSNFLYGLHLAKKYIRKYNFSIITEGPIDAIMVHKAGYPVAVATSGTAVARNHIRLLRRFSNRLVIAFDGDVAGIKATLSVIGMALSEGMDVKVVSVPEDTDPADMIAKDARQFRDAVKNASPSITYMHTYVQKSYGTAKEDILRGVKEEVLPIIAKIHDSIMYEYAINETAKFCSLSREAIEENVIGIKEKEKNKISRQTGKRYMKGLPAPKDQQQTIADLLEHVAYARSFLMSHGVSFTEEMNMLIERIEKYEHIPAAEEGVAQIRYEEEGDDKTERNDAAIRDFMNISHRLELELRKREEIKRVQSIGKT